MKAAVWKYVLRECGSELVRMPIGSHILTAQLQGDNLCLWAFGNPEATTSSRYIDVLCTGELVDDVPRRYINTVQRLNGRLVLHVFERLVLP
jgi:hypothetical protein